MNTVSAFSNAVSDALSRRPEHIWIENEFAIFGWGVAASFDVGAGFERYRRAQEALHDDITPAFASFTFDVNQQGSVVIRPATVVMADRSGQRVLVGSPPDARVEAEAMPSLVSLSSSRADWNRSFDSAIGALRSNGVEKVVLSTAIEARFNDVVPLPAVVRQLVAAQPDSYIFAVDGLVGSSPELLAGLAEHRLRSLSLAGSARTDEKATLSLSREKMIREHDFAADSVAEALAPHAVELTRGRRHQARFADIVHLATEFDGLAREGTSILDLVGDLHPTAAVAGTPSDAAVELILEIEPHARGRYAGPVGWFDGRGNGTFAIALRCGVITGAEATLFAGAGLVAGSDRDEEYLETQLKLQPMGRALAITSLS